MENLVSVIIPCFNDGRYLSETLESVESQTYSNIEIIIVDDGSTDPTTISLLKKIDLTTTITVIYQKNSGPSVARNRAVSCAKGTYILPLDADDTFHPTYIEKAVKELQTNRTFGAVTCGITYFGKAHHKITLPLEIIKEKDVVLQNRAPVSSLFRKECWEEVNGWDETMKMGFEDWDFWIRVCAKGWTIYGIQEYLFNYRLKSISRDSINNKNRTIYEQILIKKNSAIFGKYVLEIVKQKDNEIEYWKKYGILKRVNNWYKTNVYYKLKSFIYKN
jgi:glycosyltransferase involved in cell wall biosynthesis